MSQLSLAVAFATYAVSLVLVPRLPGGRWVTPVGALGPALIALGPGGFDHASYELIVGVAVATDLAVAVLRRRGLALPERIRHALLLTASASVFAALAGTMPTGFADASATAQLAVIGVCTLVFAAGEAILRGVSSGLRGGSVVRSIAGEFRASVLAHLAMASTAGLVVLSYEALGAVAFVILIGPLYATNVGFARFVLARNTYTETVRALGRLTERAGYAPPGHHERVARLCGDVATDLGMRGEPVRMLRLVALLHEVGAVSVPEPAELAGVGREALAAAGSRVLEETGYLAKHAHVLQAATRAAWEACPLEARILRVASAYDDHATRHGGESALRALKATAVLGDQPVYESLCRVIARMGGEHEAEARRRSVMRVVSPRRGG